MHKLQTPAGCAKGVELVSPHQGVHCRTWRSTKVMQHMWELQHALDGPVHWTIYTNLKPQSSKVDTHCKLPLASVLIYKWNTPCNYDVYITYTYKLAFNAHNI